jgi:hypothetical protein
MADIDAIATQFTDFYYQAFDTDRASLAALYVRQLTAHSSRSLSIFKSHSGPIPCYLSRAHLTEAPQP